MDCFLWQSLSQYLHTYMTFHFQIEPKTPQVATSLLTTSRYQDAFAWLAATCWQQVCCKLSVDRLDASCRVIHRLVTNCFNKLQQACKWQVAIILILTSLLQLVNKSQQVGKIDNLQQAVASHANASWYRVVINRLVATCASLAVYMQGVETQNLPVYKLSSWPTKFWPGYLFICLCIVWRLYFETSCVFFAL